MQLWPIQLDLELLLWFGFLICGGLLAVFRDWRITLPALLGEYLLLAALLARFPTVFVPHDLVFGTVSLSSFVLVKAVTGLTVVGILAFTVLLRRRVHALEQEASLDEVTAARLRWTMRRLQRRARPRFQLPAYLLTTFYLAVLILITYTLAVLYPLVRNPVLPEQGGSLWFYVDLVWYWLGLSGLFILLFAREMQEVSVGLLLCIASVDLLYMALSKNVGLLAIALLSAVSILLALGSAYIALLFYARLQRWELPSVEDWE